MFRVKRHFVRAAAAALSTYFIAAAVPPTITAAVTAPMYFNYQGRLKKDGSTVNDFRYFRFRLTDEAGSSEYYTSGSTRIYVTNGLFNYKVGPLDGVNFAANPLYMEVSVGEGAPDNLLLPREALVSSPYAIYAATAAYSLDSGALSSRNYSAFVSTRAENQNIAGVKTFSGYVGIGTTTPQVKLSVQAQSHSDWLIEALQTDGQKGVQIGMWNSDNSAMRLSDSVGNEKILLRALGSSHFLNGNVGIGTADTQGRLHVISDSIADKYIFVASHTISGCGIVVSTGGRVGVGISAPQSILHISKPGVVYTSLGQLRIGSTASIGDIAAITFGYDGSGATRYAPVAMGMYCTDNSGNKGDLIFSTRNGTSDIVASERMRVAADGNVTIVNLAGTGNRAVYSDPNGVLTNSSSDIRLKKDIETLSECLNNVLNLRGVKFNWDNSVDRSKKLGGQREIGMIAQEVEKVLPELVGTNSDGYKSLDYPKLTAVLVEAVKEQQIQINALRKDIENLKK